MCIPAARCRRTGIASWRIRSLASTPSASRATAARRPSCCSPAMSKSAPSPPRSPATWRRPTTCGSCFRKPAFAPRVPLLWRVHRPVVAAAPRRQKSMPVVSPTPLQRTRESPAADVGRCVSSTAGETIRVASKAPSRAVVISALGVTQIFAWGSSYYLPAVLAKPIAADTGWSLSWVVGGLSLGLLIAGLVSPWVGRAIARRGGRPVLAVSAGLLAAGLSALALAHSLPAFLIAWLVIGLGMGAGLYDPAFATLGRLYGQGGRSAITTLTLFGGFASTVCWPLSAFLDAHLGWRGACLVYAGFQLAVALPAYLFVLPRESPRPAPLPVVAEFANARAGIGRFPRKHVSPAGLDHHAEFSHLDDALGSFADGAASQRAHPRRRRGFRRARWTFSGSGPHGRDGDRALSSSDLD